MATGFDSILGEDAPALFVTGGRGNTLHPEVHLHFFDSTLGVDVGAWFDAAELLDVIREATE